MTQSNRTCSVLREFLDEIDLDASKGEQGHRMMMRRLRIYLSWKADLHKPQQNYVNPSFNATVTQPASGAGSGDSRGSAAMQKKDKERQERGASRRRVRGGAPSTSSTSQRTQTSGQEGMMKSEGMIMEEAEQIADL
jgi:DNA excision repair protein ERCC-4